MKESLKTRVNLEALNGTWFPPEPCLLLSIARIHSFKASKLCKQSVKDKMKKLAPFVNFSTFNSSSSVITLSILSSFTTLMVRFRRDFFCKKNTARSTKSNFPWALSLESRKII